MYELTLEGRDLFSYDRLAGLVLPLLHLLVLAQVRPMPLVNVDVEVDTAGVDQHEHEGKEKQGEVGLWRRH